MPLLLSLIKPSKFKSDTMIIKNARAEQAKDLAYLVNLASYGVAEYLWQGMCSPGQSPLNYGASRAARSDGNFSYKNAKVMEVNGKVAGMVLSYQQPDPYDTSDIKGYPKELIPLVELEALAPGSWYINAIATYEQYRGQGIASQLLKQCEQDALQDSCKVMSLVVAKQSAQTVALYKKLGYAGIETRPVVAFEGAVQGGEWLLMTKAL